MNQRYTFLLLSFFLIAALVPSVGASPATAPSQTYPIVDTSQSKCYNTAGEIACPASGQSFYGQDAQFTGNSASFTLSANNLTVADNTTGLTWIRTPDTNADGSLTEADKVTHTNASAYCSAQAAAHFGGFTDWRVPTIKELYSLMDFRGTDPSGFSGTDTSALTPYIDRTYFSFVYGDTSAGARVIDAQYWSSTQYVAPSIDSKTFGVNFADGRIKGYPGTIAKQFIRCVRGNTSYGINSFVNNGDNTITDNATGLMWSKPDSGTGMNWQSALAWVQTKNAENYLGHNDWRLPNAKELQGILDYSRSPDTSNSAAINALFTATQITNEGGAADYPFYWASTTHATYNGAGGFGIYVAFGRALGWIQQSGQSCYSLLDVHGAGAQRSDPKNGSYTNYYLGTSCNGGSAYGHGPQGDVIRVDNFVRLVRNTTAVASSTFSDVSASHWAYSSIESLYKAGITSGCTTSPLTYCPDSTVTRAQMAVFLLRGMHGANYQPAASTGTVFSDVSTTHWAASWIEQLRTEGITTGCSTTAYCPDSVVTRSQMAVFLLRAKYGSTYTPPAANGNVFSDVPSSNLFSAWIEQLFDEGITSGCGAGSYCPDQSVTRAEMAVFLVRTFGLP